MILVLKTISLIIHRPSIHHNMAQWADSRTNKRTNEQMSLPSYIPPDTLSRAYIARVEQEERRRKRARAILEIGSHFHDSVPEAILVPKPPGSTKTLPNGSRYGTSEKEWILRFLHGLTLILMLRQSPGCSRATRRERIRGERPSRQKVSTKS